MKRQRLLSFALSALLLAQSIVPAFAGTPLSAATSLHLPEPIRTLGIVHEAHRKEDATNVLGAHSATLTNLSALYLVAAPSHQFVEQPAVAPAPSPNPQASIHVDLGTCVSIVSPSAGMDISNFFGPDISFAPSFTEGSTPMDTGFGPRYTHPYNNVFIVRNGSVGQTPAYPRFFDLVLPNGSKVFFENALNQIPTSSNPSIILDKVDGIGNEYALATWEYDFETSSTLVRLSQKDGGELIFGAGSPVDDGYSGITGESAYRLSKIVDKVGNFVTLHYTAEQRPVQVYVSATDNWQNIYHTVRNLTAIKNSQNETLLALATDGQGNYTSSTDIFGRKRIYSVDAETNYAKIEDRLLTTYELRSISQMGVAADTSLPIETEFVHGDFGGPNGLTYRRLTQVKSVNHAGNLSATTLGFDAENRVVTMDDSNNNRVEIEYGLDSATIKNLTAPVNGTRVLERKSSLRFDGFGQITETIDAAGQVTSSYVYAESSAPFKVTEARDSQNRVWSSAYDSLGNLKSTQTPRGLRTLINDGNGGNRIHKISRVNANLPNAPLIETPTQIIYNTGGNSQPLNTIKEVRSPIPGQVNTGNTQSTFINYRPTTPNNPSDVEGLVTSLVTPGNNAEAQHTVTLTYPQTAKKGQPSQVTNGATTNGVLEQVTFTYDARGNVVRTEDALGSVTDQEYNLADQPTISYTPQNLLNLGLRSKSETIYAYVGGPAIGGIIRDSANNVVRSTTLAFDTEWNVLNQSGSGEDWSATYNSFYAPRVFKDGNLSSTRTTYDLNGRPTLIQYPGTTATSGPDTIRITGYNLDGQVTQTIDGKGMTRQYNYDLIDGALASVVGGEAFSLSLDQLTGEVTAITDGSGTRSVTLDDLGNVLSTVTTYTSTPAVTFNYEFYPDGSRKKMINPAGTWVYSYDKSGRYTSMTSPLGTTTSSYYADGMQKQRSTPLGGITNYTFTPAKLLNQLTNLKGTTVLSEFSMNQFDGARNLKAWSQSIHPPGSGPQGAQFIGNTTYSRQADSGAILKDRLTQETSTRFGGFTENNAYDNADNPTTFRGQTRQFNLNNQLVGTGFAYDGNGNPTTYAGKTAVYDHNNRLTAFPNLANTTWSANYRADNLRAWSQASSTSTPSGRVYYYYDGGNAVLERSPSGFTYSINVFAPDGLVARNYNPPPVSPGPEEEDVESMVGQAYRGDYLFDWQGNATHIVCPEQLGPNGQPMATLIHSAYNAWGQKNFLYPSNFNNELHRFGYNARSGYRTDTETGLVYCQNRYYDPANGRWVTRDPIGYAGGINLYGYCGSGPVGAFDPLGLSWSDFFAGWGDTLTFGGTKYARKWLGEALGVGDANESVNYGSTAYGAGQVVGFANDLAIGGYGIAGRLAARASSRLVQAPLKLISAAPRVGRSSKLRHQMAMVGRAVQPGEHAHHIVAWAAKAAEPSRKVLQRLGINIDDAINGVALPASYHRRMHTIAYYKNVNARLAGATSREHAEQILRDIAEALFKDAYK
ncbi:MAG: AHH domain-containing protein [Chthonomonas sp.]|nr:AHH domain-containing protein [Chthonomonas sp.]